jgi:hypothetical protein
MTSEELNKTIDQLRNSPETANIQIAALYEIAFQLAKLNEHFEMVDGAVFGGVNNAKKEKEKQIRKT